MATKIHTRLIVEMLGKPKEYIVKTLAAFVSRFEKDLEITKKEFADPVEQAGGMFSVFCELEIMFRSIDELFGFCFDAMPTSVEILDPEHVDFPANRLSDFLNDVQGKIHQTDKAVKQLSAKNEQLDTNATHILHNFLLYMIEEGPKEIEFLSPRIGLPSKQVEKFLSYLIEQKKVVKEGNAYKIRR
jgi:hypothetical protein